MKATNGGGLGGLPDGSPKRGHGMHRTKLFSCAAAALISVAPIFGSTASQAKPRYMFTPDGVMVIIAAQGIYVPPLTHRPGAQAIYSNIGTKYPKGEYFPSQGYSIAGPDSAFGAQSWLAAAFTPAANAIVTELVVGIGWLGGENGVAIQLFGCQRPAGQVAEIILYCQYSTSRAML